MKSKTKIIQVSNIAPQTTKDQMSSLFGYLGKIEDIRLYPTIRDVAIPVQSRMCFIKFHERETVGVAQHLTNTVFIDRALVVIPYMNGDMPDEKTAMDILNSNGGIPGLASDGTWPPHVTNQIYGILLRTVDPKLAENGLPDYPNLPATTESYKVNEIRRTAVFDNINPLATAEEFLSFSERAGQVKYLRMGTELNGSKNCLVEYSEQGYIIDALKLSDVEFMGLPIKVNHSTVAIIKPQTKSNEAAQREIEEAMRRVKDAQNSIFSTTIDPMSFLDAATKDKFSISRSRSRSHSRKRSRSRSKGSHSNHRSYSRSKKRSHSRSRKSHSRSKSHSSRRDKDKDKDKHRDSRSSRSRRSSREKKPKEKSPSRSKETEEKKKSVTPVCEEKSEKKDELMPEVVEKEDEEKVEMKSPDKIDEVKEENAKDSKEKNKRDKEKKSSSSRSRRSRSRSRSKSREKQSKKSRSSSRSRRRSKSKDRKRKPRSRSKSIHRSRSISRNIKGRSRDIARRSRSRDRSKLRSSSKSRRSARHRSRSRDRKERRDKDKEREKKDKKKEKRDEKEKRVENNVTRNYDDEEEEMFDLIKKAEEKEDKEETVDMDISNSP